LLIVAAARPELFERRPNWGEGRELYSRLELKPLSKRATRSLVEEILQKADELPETLRELIVEAAEGNPYYVEELIKMLIEDGIIVRQEPNWRVELQRLAEVRVPPTLTAVLQARLDALPQDEKAVLQRASVVGRRFWDSLVGELASDTDQGTEVQPLLGALRQRELVFQREQSSFANAREYTFKHAILRDVTYETVLLRLRRRYHAQVAAWLEAHAGQRLSEYLGVIAGHYELAGERVRAAEYLRRSGEEALRTSAYRDAQAAFERALGLLPAELGEQRGTVAVRLGQTLLRLGEFSAAGAQLEEGLTLARSAGEHGTEVVALNALGEAAWRRGHWEAALGHLRNALALAQDCGDLSGQALAAQQLARVSWLHCEPDEAERWAQQSRDCCAQAGDRQGLIAARNELGNVANLRREFEQAREFYSANLALAGELGDRFAIAQALNNLGTIAYELGAYKEASAYYEQALVINDEIGNRVGLIIALGNLAELYITQGQDDPAWEYLRQALRQVVSIQAVVSATVPLLVYVARLRARAGQLERAAELLGMALSHPASSSDAEWDAQQVLGTLREALGAERLEAALARGAKLDAERVVAEILAEDNP
jgi:predicted ATPase